MPQATTKTLSMVRRSSSDEPQLVEHDAGAVEVAEQGVGDRLRLLGDLLVHEGRVAALLGGGQVPVDVEGAVVGDGLARRRRR